MAVSSQALGRWGPVVAFTIIYTASAGICLALTRGTGAVATLWPSNALLLAALLVATCGKGRYLAAAFLGNLAANLVVGNASGLSIMLSALNVAETALIAAFVRRVCRSDAIFDDPLDVIRFAAAAALPAAGAALTASLIVTGAGQDMWPVFAAWFPADILAMLVVTPIAVLAVRIVQGRPEARPGRSWAEILLVLTAVTAAAVGTFGQSRFPFLILPIPFLVVATYRLGPFGAAAATLIIATVGGTATALGFGPVTMLQGDDLLRIQYFQFYLAILFVTVSPLAALLAERRQLLARALVSERRYRGVIERANEVIFETDATGRWTFLNPAWKALTGWDVDQSLGRSFLSMVHPDDRAEALELSAPLLAGDIEELTQEIRLLLPNGEERWASICSRMVHDAEGAVVGTCGTLHDISARRAAEQKAAAATAGLAESHRLLTMAEATARLGHWRVDFVDHSVHWSDQVFLIHGLQPGTRITPDQPVEFYHPDDRAHTRGIFEAATTSGGDFVLDARLQRPDGEVRHVSVRGQAEHGPDGTVSGLFGIMQDVTERALAEARLREEEARYRRLADNATDVVLRVDREGRCLYLSPSVMEITGFSPQELIGTDLGALIHRDDLPDVASAHTQVLSGQIQSAVTQYRTPHKDGRWLWLEANLRAERDPDSRRIIGLIGSARDIGDRKALELELIAARDAARATAARMTQLATTDELTRLANRRHFLDRLDEELRRAARNPAPLCLAVFDIDFFKRTNDAHGHPGGDQVLRRVAAVARETMRATDLVGRIGGEEFAVLMPGTDLHAAELACERLREAVATTSIRLPSGIRTYATISIGVASRSTDEGASHLLRRADEALYAAKHAGRNRLKIAA